MLGTLWRGHDGYYSHTLVRLSWLELPGVVSNRIELIRLIRM